MDREIDAIIEVAAQGPLDGVSLLGGEPFDQATALTQFVCALRGRAPQLGVIVFTGYRVENLRERLELEALWGLVDTVIDGPFDATRREPAIGGRRYIGSTNQRIVHLTDRYADPGLWRGPAAAELQIDSKGELTIHGEPALTRSLRRSLLAAAGP